MPKWLPSTFSAMLSKATGTTPSLQDNKGRRDAIIPHQLLSASKRPQSYFSVSFMVLTSLVGFSFAGRDDSDAFLAYRQHCNRGVTFFGHRSGRNALLCSTLRWFSFEKAYFASFAQPDE